jgi:hypothetical protein
MIVHDRTRLIGRLPEPFARASGALNYAAAKLCVSTAAIAFA